MMYENSSVSVIDTRTKLYNDMVAMFGPLPNPTHEPRRYDWYCKLFAFRLKQKGIDFDQAYPSMETSLDVRV